LETHLVDSGSWYECCNFSLKLVAIIEATSSLVAEAAGATTSLVADEV